MAHSTKTRHAPCHAEPGAWELIPGVPDVLAAYDWTHVGFGLVTNQAGISLGFADERTVVEEIEKTIQAIFPAWPLTVDGRRRRFPQRGPVYRYAPEAPDASSYARKPSPYMLLDLARVFEARLDRTLYVGDSDIDAEAAARAGVAFIPAWQFFGWPAQPLNGQRYDTRSDR